MSPVVVALVVVELPEMVRSPAIVEEADAMKPPVRVERPVTERVPVVVRLPEASIKKRDVPVLSTKLAKLPEKPAVDEAKMRSPVVEVAARARRALMVVVGAVPSDRRFAKSQKPVMVSFCPLRVMPEFA